MISFEISYIQSWETLLPFNSLHHFCSRNMTLDIYYRYIITFCSYNGNSIDHMPCRIYNFGRIFFTFYASGDLLGNATHNETNYFDFLFVNNLINTFSNTNNHHIMAGELVFNVCKKIDDM